MSRLINEDIFKREFKNIFRSYYHKIGISTLRSLSYKNGKGINIAILDSGVDITHQYLLGKVVEAKSFIDNNPIDLYGHGTAVSGIMLSKNIGLCKGCRLYSYKITNSGNVNVINIVKAFNYIINNTIDDIDIIILPFSTNENNIHIKNMIDYLYSKGKVIISSKKNNSDIKSYPADYDNVISVGNVNCDISIKNYNIPTTATNNRFVMVEGNSYLTAIASSIAVLIISLYRKYNIKWDLKKIKEDISTTNGVINSLKFFIAKENNKTEVNNNAKCNNKYRV